LGSPRIIFLVYKFQKHGDDRRKVITMVDIANTDWIVISTFFTALGTCATAIYTIAFIITLVYLKKELHEMRLATYAGAYKAIVEILQAEDVLSAREYVFNKLPDKSFKSWNKKDRREAEKVCRSYDAVGQMVRHEFLPKEYVVDSWGNSLRRSWPILSPLVLACREEWNYAEVWDDFDWLANEAYPLQKPVS
jgi:hypothetical protein